MSSEPFKKMFLLIVCGLRLLAAIVAQIRENHDEEMRHVAWAILMYVMATL